MKGNLYDITAVLAYSCPLLLTKVYYTEGQVIDQLLLSSFIPRCVLAGESFLDSWLELKVAWITTPSAR